LTTVVRPSEAELSAIARRISGPLTPEGAENWYRSDAAALILEIRTLWREAEAARHSFLSDGVQAEPDATLYEWAKAWKATATGFWEKTQTKNLRTRIVELTRANEDLQAALEKEREEHEQHVARLTANWTERSEAVKQQIAHWLAML